MRELITDKCIGMTNFSVSFKDGFKGAEAQLKSLTLAERERLAMLSDEDLLDYFVDLRDRSNEDGIKP